MKMKKKILLGKANDYTMHIRSILIRMGFDVITFKSMSELKDTLKTESPNLILLYSSLSRTEDKGFLDYIKENEKTSGIPLIIISTESDEETRIKCDALGCSAYLLKPVGIKELHNVLQDFVYAPSGYMRKNIRASYYGLVSVSFNHETQELSSETLSEGGIYVATDNPLPVGSEVTVTIPMDIINKISVQGRVIYVIPISSEEMEFPLGMAIEFVEKDDDKLLVISDFVKGLLTIPYQDPQILKSRLT
jgi:CheY-like chemotaxis protein/Tfp pilus assembly protein PilZ